jgi:hypothetical protein
MMESEQVKELLLQSLEHERGSVDVYQTAVKCAQLDALKEDWTRCISDIRHRELLLTELCRKLSFNPEHMTCTREVTKYLGEALTSAMELAHESGKPHQAQLIAAECVTLCETTTHSNWHLIAQCGRESSGEQKQLLDAAVGEVEEEVDRQFYRAHGWERELHLQSLGIKAVLPPPEEREQVISPVRAARIQHRRERDSLGAHRSS